MTAEQTPLERAAEVFTDAWDAGIATWEGDDALAYTRHCMQAVADAGLLRPEMTAEEFHDGETVARRYVTEWEQVTDRG